MSYSAMAHALTGYVEGHLECFGIRSMSECFGFSQAYLRELFLKNMDMPIMQYYRRRRLITSASELLHSDRRIIDIALESGFSSHEAYEGFSETLRNAAEPVSAGQTVHRAKTAGVGRVRAGAHCRRREKEQWSDDKTE